MDDLNEEIAREKTFDEMGRPDQSLEGALQNSTASQEERESGVIRKRSKGMNNAERQRKRREDLAKKGIGQVNVTVDNKFKPVIKFLAKQSLNGQDFCKAIEHVRRKICPALQPKLQIAPSPKPPTRTPEQLKHDKRVIFLGEKAYALKGWRKILMEISLGI